MHISHLIPIKSVIVCLSLSFSLFAHKGLGQTVTDKGYDSLYYQLFPESIVTRIYLSQKYTTLELKKGNDAPRLRYHPNTNLNLGIGASYRNFSLNLGYGFGFLNHDQEKGKAKKLDLQARFYGRKWAIDIFGQFYKEYYVFPKGRGNTDNVNYYIRPDLKLNLAGFSAYRIINYKRFTLEPPFTQDGYQKKSAGSFLAGAEIYYGTVKGDSALVPPELELFYDGRAISRVRIFEIGPGAGYAYTQVLPHHLYISGSFTLNLNLGLVGETGNNGNTNHLSVNANMQYRLGAGYNDGNWNVNVFWVNTRFAAKGDVTGNNYLINAGNYRINFSKRLEPGRRLKKILLPVHKILKA